MNENFEATIAALPGFPSTEDDLQKRQIANKIRAYYFKDGIFSRENINNLTDVRLS